jgi:tetratricopeptide (TPR) repeat protein
LRVSTFWDGPTPEVHAALRDCLERAVELDPTYANAWQVLAALYRFEHEYGFNPLPNPLDRALNAAQKAFESDPNNLMGPFRLAEVHFFRHELDEFNKWADRTIEMNPNNATSLALLGGWVTWVGRVDEGLAMLKRAVELNPRYPSWYNYFLSGGHFMRGEYQGALDAALGLDWGVRWDYVARAVAYAQLGRIEEARQQIDKLNEVDPEFGELVWERFRLFNFPDESIRQYIEGLRKAGLEVAEEPPLTQ